VRLQYVADRVPLRGTRARHRLRWRPVERSAGPARR
jgi:hypothetical protein